MIPLSAKDISLFLDVVKYKIVTYNARLIANGSAKLFLRITRLLTENIETLKCQVKVVFILSKAGKSMNTFKSYVYGALFSKRKSFLVRFTQSSFETS